MMPLALLLLPLFFLSSVPLFLMDLPLLTTSLFPTLLLFVDFCGRIRCLLLVEVYFIPFAHARAIRQTLVLVLHTCPIIFMGFIPGYWAHGLPSYTGNTVHHGLHRIHNCSNKIGSGGLGSIGVQFIRATASLCIYALLGRGLLVDIADFPN